eukprot:6435476-Prymnesium_polylepis.1
MGRRAPVLQFVGRALEAWHDAGRGAQADGHVHRRDRQALHGQHAQLPDQSRRQGRLPRAEVRQGPVCPLIGLWWGVRRWCRTFTGTAFGAARSNRRFARY